MLENQKKKKKQCVDTQIDRSRVKNSEVVGHQRLTGKRRNYLNTHKKTLEEKMRCKLDAVQINYNIGGRPLSMQRKFLIY